MKNQLKECQNCEKLITKWNICRRCSEALREAMPKKTKREAKKEPKKKKLTMKQEKFVKELVKTGNGTKAAKTAWYSSKTARTIASQNLTKLNIKEKIEELSDFALDVIKELTGDPETPAHVRMTGAKDILDRAWHGAVNKVAGVLAVGTTELEPEDKEMLKEFLFLNKKTEWENT